MRLVTFVLIVAAACGPNQHSGIKYPADPPPKEIVLGVGDIVEINVWEQRDLASEATIRPDGTITMPLVGDLQAKGKTPLELAGFDCQFTGAAARSELGSDITDLLTQLPDGTFTRKQADEIFAAFDRLADDKLPDENGLARIAEFARVIAAAKPSDKLKEADLAWAKQVQESIGGLIAIL